MFALFVLPVGLSSSCYSYIITLLFYPLVDDVSTTPFGTPANIPVLDNDDSPDGNVLTVRSIVDQPTGGAVTILPNGTVTYTPNPDFQGQDLFTYRVCNSVTNQCDEANVTMTVGLHPSPVSAPVASEFSYLIGITKMLSIGGILVAGFTFIAVLTVSLIANHCFPTYSTTPRTISS